MGKKAEKFASSESSISLRRYRFWLTASMPVGGRLILKPINSIGRSALILVLNLFSCGLAFLAKVFVVGAKYVVDVEATDLLLCIIRYVDIEAWIKSERDQIQVSTIISANDVMPIVARVGSTIHGPHHLKTLEVSKTNLRWDVVDDNQSFQCFVCFRVRLWRVFKPKFEAVHCGAGQQ